MKRKYRLIAKNILRIDKLFNAAGNVFINPLLANKMPFQPYHFDIEPTTKCNLTCSFCQVPGWERSNLPNLSFSDFKDILEKNPFLLGIKLQGMGEPFLNENICRMVEYASSRQIETYINTNGTIFDRETIKTVFKNRLSQLSFSLDTPNRETYQKIRGKDLFDKVFENIKIAVKERDALSSDTKINIWCVLIEHNINEMTDMIKAAKELKVDKLTIQTSLSSFGKDSVREKNKEIKVSSSEKVAKDVLNKIKAFAGEIGINLDIYRDNYFSKDRPCSWVKHRAYISVEGEVIPCCVLGSPEALSMGNIHQVKNFSEIWNNKKYRDFRTTINENKLSNFCKDCYMKP